MPKIPRVMSTQHPDNVRLPFFAESPDMSGEKVTGRIIKAIKEDNSDLQSMIEEAAYLRWVLQIEVSAWPDGVSA